MSLTVMFLNIQHKPFHFPPIKRMYFNWVKDWFAIEKLHQNIKESHDQ